MKVCPCCGENVDDKFKFCPYCGGKMENLCPSCGEKVDGKFKFCPYCGSTMEKSAGKSAAATSVAETDEGLFDFGAMESGFDEQLAAQAEYDKKLALAKSYLIRKRYDEARKVYDGLLEIDPMDVNAYIGYVRVASENFTKLEGTEIDDAIAAAKEAAGSDDLSAFDPQYAGFEDKRKKYFKEQEKCKAEEAKKAEQKRKAEEAKKAAEAARIAEERRKAEAKKKNFLSNAEVEGTTLKKYKGGGVVEIPDFITRIGAGAFFQCMAMTDLKLSGSITEIGETAFFGCSRLTKLEIPDGVTSIGVRAFTGCENLSEVTIPDTVKFIGENAFFDCNRLINVTVSEKNNVFKSINGSLYSKDGKTLIRYATGRTDGAFVVPDGVTSIGKYAFYKCASLTNVALPNSIINIEDAAFASCINLTNISFSSNLMSVGKSAFSGTNLKNVVLPDKLKEISGHTFSYCKNLTSIVIPESVTSIGQDAFYKCENLTSATFKNLNGYWKFSGGSFLMGKEFSDARKAAEHLREYWIYSWEKC